MNRRTAMGWLASTGLGALGVDMVPALRQAAEDSVPVTPNGGTPDDEVFWAKMRDAFEHTPGQVNLVTVVRGVTPKAVRAAIEKEGARMNAFGPRDPADAEWRGRVRGKAAAFIGAAPNEVSLVRNTTEGVTTVLLGWPLSRGDEILSSSTEHGHFYDTLAQRAARDGVALRRVHLPTPASSPAAIVDAVDAAMTSRTRLVLLPHVVLTGQILPVRAIADRVHARGARFLVDGVLGVGHVATDVKAMDCDFYAAGFHKWGCGPRATAVFYVKPELVQRLAPLFGRVKEDSRLGAVPQWDSGDMEKFEVYGAHPEWHFYSLGPALDFLSQIGIDRIQPRLFTLTKRWAQRAQKLAGFRLAVNVDPVHCAGLAAWEWTGRTDAADRVRQARVLVGGTELYGGVFGIPESAPRSLNISNAGIFTSPADVDRFADVLESIANG